MAIAQVNTTGSNHTAGATTLNVTITAATAGNKIIVCAIRPGGTSTITFNLPTDNIGDNGGANPWTRVYNPGNSNGNRLEVFEKEAVGGETTITVTPSSSVTYSLFAYEFSGMPSTTAFDTNSTPGTISTASATGGTMTCGSVTPSAAGGLSMIVAGVNGTYTAGTQSQTDSLVSPVTYGNDASTVRCWIGTDIKAATTAFTGSATFTSTAGRAGTTWTLVFKAAVATKAPVPTSSDTRRRPFLRR